MKHCRRKYSVAVGRAPDRFSDSLNASSRSSIAPIQPEPASSTPSRRLGNRSSVPSEKNEISACCTMARNQIASPHARPWYGQSKMPAAAACGVNVG